MTWKGPYLDFRDWWIGCYRDPANARLYICLFPCVVIRLTWSR